MSGQEITAFNRMGKQVVLVHRSTGMPVLTGEKIVRAVYTLVVIGGEYGGPTASSTGFINCYVPPNEKEVKSYMPATLGMEWRLK